MDEKNEQNTLPSGYFPLRINASTGMAQRFINMVGTQYDVIVINPPTRTPHNDEETIIAVPFSYKERVRIDFNIFASEVEAEERVTSEFRMESAF